MIHGGPDHNYKQMVDRINEGIVVYDRNLHLSFMNAFMEKLTGKLLKNEQGRHVNQVFPDIESSGSFYYLEQALENITTDAVELKRIAQRTGNVSWTSQTYSPYFNNEGEVAGVIVTVQDISSRKKAQQNARRNETLNRAVLEAIPDVVVLLDKKGTYLDFMTTNWSQLAFTPEQMQGKTFRDVLPPEVGELSTDAVTRAISTGRLQTIEYHLPYQGGTRWFEARINALDDDHAIAIVRNITESKEVYQALVRERERVQSASEAKSHFMASMSHEVRTPLNGLMGMIELMQLTELTEEQKDYLKLSMYSAQGLLNVVNDILTYAKGEAGEIVIAEKPYRLDELLKNITDIYQVCGEDQGIQIRYQLDPDVPIHLVGDSFRLRQVLANLISNAVKYTEEGSIILTVRCLEFEADDESVQLEFQLTDTGFGIPAKDLPTIFDSFKQVTDEQEQYQSGSGLGLSICKQLVELMGGTIWVESQEGTGTTFSFTIICKSPARR